MTSGRGAVSDGNAIRPVTGERFRGEQSPIRGGWLHAARRSRSERTLPRPSLDFPGWGFCLRLAAVVAMCGMSTSIEIRDLADLASEYLRRDRGFARLKAIVQIMQPWHLIQMEQDDESDAFHLTFADGGNEINFASDGSGSVYVKKSGDEKWKAETASRNSMQIHEIISVITDIKRKLNSRPA